MNLYISVIQSLRCLRCTKTVLHCNIRLLLTIGFSFFSNKQFSYKTSIVTVNFSSIVNPSNKTSSLASTLIEFILKLCLWWELYPRILSWSFPGLAFKEFNLNLFKILFVAEIRFPFISINLSLHKFTVLSSAKLQICDCSIIMNMSLIHILNKSGPNIEPPGIFSLVFDYLL